MVGGVVVVVFGGRGWEVVVVGGVGAGAVGASFTCLAVVVAGVDAFFPGAVAPRWVPRLQGGLPGAWARALS